MDISLHDSYERVTFVNPEDEKLLRCNLLEDLPLQVYVINCSDLPQSNLNTKGRCDIPCTYFTIDVFTPLSIFCLRSNVGRTLPVVTSIFADLGFLSLPPLLSL